MSKKIKLFLFEQIVTSRTKMRPLDIMELYTDTYYIQRIKKEIRHALPVFWIDIAALFIR